MRVWQIRMIHANFPGGNVNTPVPAAAAIGSVQAVNQLTPLQAQQACAILTAWLNTLQNQNPPAPLYSIDATRGWFQYDDWVTAITTLQGGAIGAGNNFS